MIRRRQAPLTISSCSAMSLSNPSFVAPRTAAATLLKFIVRLKLQGTAALHPAGAVIK
jgi:hypothetical protein